VSQNIVAYGDSRPNGIGSFDERADAAGDCDGISELCGECGEA
jgi:hypothetical protein